RRLGRRDHFGPAAVIFFRGNLVLAVIVQELHELLPFAGWESGVFFRTGRGGTVGGFLSRAHGLHFLWHRGGLGHYRSPFLRRYCFTFRAPAKFFFLFRSD